MACILHMSILGALTCLEAEIYESKGEGITSLFSE